MFSTDLNANIEYANQACCETSGYQLTELIGTHPRIFRSGHTDTCLYTQMWTALKKGESWHGNLINARKDGSEYIESVIFTPVKEKNGRITHYLAIKRDITEQQKAHEQIQQLAFFDPLTNLSNRRKLLDRLNYTIALAKRENRIFAVFMMDLDKFKPVNDKLGHAAGDDLLKQVAKRISERLRESDMAARLGGDEFVLVLENITHTDDAAQIANDIINDLTEPFELSLGDKVQIGTSIGISFYPQHGETPEKLIDHADLALYHAKENGRGCFAYFEK